MVEEKHESTKVTEDINFPIQAASITDTTGKITPVWFKYQGDDYQIYKVKEINVLSSKEINYVGFKMIQFICSAPMRESEQARMFELRYNIGTHKWTLYQMLN